METATLSEASVYVGTYGKYNNGSLFGAWLDLSDYADKEEFYEACRELHKDEEDAEFMFQDWENVPEGLIGESWISENFFTLRDAEGNGLATAMVPWGAGCPIIVGIGNRDPYVEHAEAIRVLAAHLGLPLERGRCYPYGR